MNTPYKFNTPFTLSETHPNWKECCVTSVTIALGSWSYSLTDTLITLRRDGGSSMATTICALEVVDGVSFKFRITINAAYSEETQCLLFNETEFNFLRMEVAQHINLSDEETMETCVAVFKRCQTAKLTQFSLNVAV